MNHFEGRKIARLLFFFWCCPLGHSQTPVSLVAGNKCQERIESDLKNWGCLNQWRQTLEVDPRNFERSIYVSPTKNFAQWVRLEKNRSSITLYKVNAYNTLQLSYDKDCSPKSNFIPKNLVPNRFYQEFSDQELKLVLKKEQRGLIYVWSTQNPAWKSGLETIIAVAAKEKLPLIALLEARLTKAEVLALSKEHKNFPPAYFRQLSSVELEFHGALEKAPALIFYRDGKIHPDLLYGAKNAGTYQEFLRPLLER